MSTHPTWVFDDSPIADPFGFGDRAVRFLRALTHPKTGKAFRLDPWQERIVRRIYGPRKDDGTRIVKNVVMMVPRGARKTSLGAALGMLHTFGPERVALGQVIAAAHDHTQARIAYDEATGLVNADRLIKAATKVLDYKSTIRHKGSKAKFTAVASDAAAQNGMTPAFCLIDEIHAWKKRDLYDVLRTGLGKTAGTLSIVISQAGRGQENVAFEVFDYARKVARGDIVDPGTLPILFETPADADWRDEQLWHRVNPGLQYGYPDLDALRQEAREAENRPALREKFRNDHLNVWLDHSHDPFVEMSIYDRGAAPIDLETLTKQPCWIGVDMSVTTDLSAVVAAFQDGEGGFIVVPHFFCPGDNLRARADRDGVPYPQWAEGGFITPTPGNVIDYGAIEACIRGLCERFEVREIGFDPAYAQSVMGPLADDGFPVMTIRQGWVTQAPAVNELERAIIGGKFQHGGHPVLRWNFSNIAIHTDSAGNRTMHKGKSTDRIDGAVATWMAVSRAAHGGGIHTIFEHPDFNPADLVW